MELIRHAVCRIEPQPETKSKSSLEGYATGFLVGPGIVLTCYHVAKNFLSKDVSLQTRIRFDYEFGTDNPRIGAAPILWLINGSWRTAQ